MLNQVNEAVRRSSRLMTLRHPNAVDVAVYRKVMLRPDEDTDNNNPNTLGGALFLANEDESDFEVALIGVGKMLFLGRVAGSEYAANGLDYGETQVNAYIEPVIENEFLPQKEDRVFWIEGAFVKPYQILGIDSPNQMPLSRLLVYRLQPLEASTVEYAP